MVNSSNRKRLGVLFVGDLVVLGLITAYGFAEHGTLGTAGARILTTLVPTISAWLLVAPFFGLYRVERAASPAGVALAFWAMVVAGPFAAWMRAVLLGGLTTMISPLFVVIMGGFSALAILAWRALFLLFYSRKKSTL